MATIGHLMIPIDISGTLHCVKHGATTPKWRTASLLGSNAALSSAEDADSWDISPAYGTIRFGTCCIWKATVRFNMEDELSGPGYGYWVKINGTFVDAHYYGVPTSVDVEIDLNALGLMGRPCGNDWELTCYFGGTVEIIDVTFGPPV